MFDNAPHLHLLVNHFPVIGAALAVPVLLLALVLRKERGLLLAGVLLLAVVAVTSWLSIETGEKAMDWLDNSEGKPWFRLWDAARDYVDEHEERAEKAALAAYAVAALGIVLLAFAHFRPPESPLPRFWIALLLLGSVAVAGAMGWVGNSGGVIMHREVRGDALDTVTKHVESGEHRADRAEGDRK